MPKIWVGRTTLNGEKTGRALSDGQTTSWSSYNLELVNIGSEESMAESYRFGEQ